MLIFKSGHADALGVIKKKKKEFIPKPADFFYLRVSFMREDFRINQSDFLGQRAETGIHPCRTVGHNLVLVCGGSLFHRSMW